MGLFPGRGRSGTIRAEQQASAAIRTTVSPFIPDACRVELTTSAICAGARKRLVDRVRSKEILRQQKKPFCALWTSEFLRRERG